MRRWSSLSSTICRRHGRTAGFPQCTTCRHQVFHALHGVSRALGHGPNPARAGHPPAKTDTRLVRHLTATEIQALLDAPKPSDWLGTRDRAMLHLTFAAGLRVSELTGLRLQDLTLQPQASVLIHGKGRRERSLPLWKETTTALRRGWQPRIAPAPEIFVNARREPMTRAGFEYILEKHVRTAIKRCPSLASKRISPHALRHSCALTVLEATKISVKSRCGSVTPTCKRLRCTHALIRRLS